MASEDDKKARCQERVCTFPTELMCRRVINSVSLLELDMAYTGYGPGSTNDKIICTRSRTLRGLCLDPHLLGDKTSELWYKLGSDNTTAMRDTKHEVYLPQKNF